MDKIIWDVETLLSIIRLLNTAVYSLEDCDAQLRRLRSETQTAFRGKTGTLEDELQRGMDQCVIRLDKTRERISDLATAAGESVELISATERSLCRMAEDLPISVPPALSRQTGRTNP